MDRAAIVVPIYKEILNDLEKISLNQCLSILGNYPICFAIPNNKKIPYINGHINVIKKFDSGYFDSIESYSKLCMSYEFYEAFKEYEYILIYQLDAFVFSDRLLEFCDRGYDFIGAPAPTSAWKGLPYNVGNGGFSLRKVSSFLQITSQISDIICDFISEYGEVINDNSIYSMEDCIFGYCGWRKDINFNVPSVVEAFDFSIEFNINGIYKRLNTYLPFGCHRWHTYRFSTWWDKIKDYGYKINETIYLEQSNKYPWHEYRVLMSMLEREERTREISEIIIDIIHSSKVRLWGGGKEGKKIALNMRKMGFDVAVIYDKSASSENISPTIDIVKSSRLPIIISSISYDKEISKELNGMGLEKETDFYAWRDIVFSINERLGINEVGETLRQL